LAGRCPNPQDCLAHDLPDGRNDLAAAWTGSGMAAGIAAGIAFATIDCSISPADLHALLTIKNSHISTETIFNFAN
jgi:hypothetical protein